MSPSVNEPVSVDSVGGTWIIQKQIRIRIKINTRVSLVIHAYACTGTSRVPNPADAESRLCHGMSQSGRWRGSGCARDISRHHCRNPFKSPLSYSLTARVGSFQRKGPCRRWRSWTVSTSRGTEQRRFVRPAALEKPQMVSPAISSLGQAREQGSEQRCQQL